MGFFRSLTNRSYRDPVIVAERVNELLYSSDFLNSLIDDVDFNAISTVISRVMEYYILNDDSRVDYTYEEWKEICVQSENFDYGKYMDNPILATSSNGYNKKNIKKHGFKNRYFDLELSEDIKYAESKLSESSFWNFQRLGLNDSKINDKDYMFFTLPGSLVVEYSMKLSPERLFMGILLQNYPLMLPYKIGEGKENYFKRVIDSKISDLGLEGDERLKKACDRILKKMCSKDPLIVLFPQKSKVRGKEIEVKACVGRITNGSEKNLGEFISSPFVDGKADFVSGGQYSENAGNLVTTDLNVNKSDIGIIDVPDYFKCLELKAKQLGFNVGEEIDILTCRKPISLSDNMTPINLGGTGRMFEIKLYGRSFLYKPAEKKYTYEVEKFRGIVQNCAFQVQKMVRSDSCVPCYYVEDNGICGTIQPKIYVGNNKKDYYNIQSDNDYDFSKRELKQFMEEFVVDYLLCNFDSHGKNFVCDSSGKIFGVDKEQSFRYINESNCNFLDINCNPNSKYGEKETMYNYIFKRYINKSLDIDFSVIEECIKKVESVSDDRYRSIFSNYCKSIENEFGTDSNVLLNKIVDRKRNIRENLSTFIYGLNRQRNNGYIDKKDDSITQTIAPVSSFENVEYKSVSK